MSGSRDQEVEVVVTLSIQSGEIVAWLFDLEYDPAVAQPVSCSAGAEGLCNSAYSSNTVRFLAASETKPGEIARVKFRLIGPSGSASPLTFKNVDCINDAGSLDCSATGGELRIS